MRALKPLLANWLWFQSSKRHYRRFLPTLGHPEEVQRHYLIRLLRLNAETEYGKRYGFADMTSVEDYRRRVPLTAYEDYLPYIERIAKGEKGVLTAEPVSLFQPSSGTSSASKLIPYTRSLNTEFQRSIGAWIASLFKRKPGLMRGTAYWSVTPSIASDERYFKMPVGFADDAEYLGFFGKRLFSMVSAVPQTVALQHDTHIFFLHMLAHLLAARDLSMISVWSPTYLLLLLRKLIDHREEILTLLQNMNLPGGKSRAESIRRILRQKEGDSPFEHIWPKLGLISCWTHGQSELYLKEIKQHFPDVEIQGKGLIATEAFVSLPFTPFHDPVLAVNSHFFEFREAEDNVIRLPHELEEGKQYSVIVSTGGGLYRYQLCDLIKVTGFIDNTPTLRFVTKEAVSDLFGEKLQADHVQNSVVSVFNAYSVQPSFFLLAPVNTKGNGIAYCLFIDALSVANEQVNSMRDMLERMLRDNFHFAHCQNIGQLGALKVFLIDRAYNTPEDVFTREMHRRGLKLGNIKPANLDHETGWENRFSGHFADTPPPD